MFLVHVRTILNNREVCSPLRTMPKGDTFCCRLYNWATNRNWQTKLLDRRKVTQLNLLCRERVKLLPFPLVPDRFGLYSEMCITDQFCFYGKSLTETGIFISLQLFDCRDLRKLK